MATPISPAQLRAIYGMARKAGMDNDDLHATVKKLTGAESLKALTGYRAALVIDYLKDILGQPVSTSSPARATPGQQYKIVELAREMGWMDDPRRLRGFVEKQYHVSDIRFLTPAQAGLCIEALKAIQAGGRGERRRPPDDTQMG